MSRILNTTAKLALVGALTFGLGTSAMAMTPLNKGHNFHTPKYAKHRVLKNWKWAHYSLAKTYKVTQPSMAKAPASNAR